MFTNPSGLQNVLVNEEITLADLYRWLQELINDKHTRTNSQSL